jgi:hypothetical protein
MKDDVFSMDPDLGTYLNSNRRLIEPMYMWIVTSQCDDNVDIEIIIIIMMIMMMMMMMMMIETMIVIIMNDNVHYNYST